MSGLGELKRFEADLEKNEGLHKRLDEVARRFHDHGWRALSDGKEPNAYRRPFGHKGCH